MTVVNDQVYIFGGATMQCVCELHIVNNEEKRVCSSKNVYSNELWHYDPLASMFTQLGWNTTADDNEEKAPWPPGREQHSMTKHVLLYDHVTVAGVFPKRPRPFPLPREVPSAVPAAISFKSRDISETV